MFITVTNVHWARWHVKENLLAVSFIFIYFFNELQGKVSEYKGGSVGQSSCTCAGCGLSLGHESANAASDDGPADGAVTQAGGAVAAHHQVTTGDEDDGHQLVHAHLAGPLLLQLPQQLLGAGVCRCWNNTKTFVGNHAKHPPPRSPLVCCFNRPRKSICVCKIIRWTLTFLSDWRLRPDISSTGALPRLRVWRVQT